MNNVETHLSSVFGYNVVIPNHLWGQLAQKMDIKWQVDPKLWADRHDCFVQLLAWVKTVEPAYYEVGTVPKAFVHGVYYALFPKAPISAEMMFTTYPYTSEIDYRYKFAYRGLVHNGTHFTSQYAEALKDPRLDQPDLRPGDLVQPLEDDNSCLEVASTEGEMVTLNYQNTPLTIPKALVRLAYNAVPFNWDGPWPDEPPAFSTLLNQFLNLEI